MAFAVQKKYDSTGKYVKMKSNPLIWKYVHNDAMDHTILALFAQNK